MHDSTYDETREQAARPRRAGPRFGSFFTIAVALLLLFGAASRVGKLPETAALFGIDLAHEKRILHEEERLRTAISIGTVPVRQSGDGDARLPIDSDALPPQRAIPVTPPGAHSIGDIASPGFDSNQRAAVSIPYQDDRYDGDAPVAPRDEAPAARPNRPSTYVVAQGDTWIKIAKKTLGDGKRWQDIQRANPASQNGLSVGMRLMIPQ